MEKAKRRARYRYDIRVNGRSWTQATTLALAEAASKAALRTWAKGKIIEICEIKNGALSPFTEAKA